MALDCSKDDLVTQLRYRAKIVRQHPDNPSKIADLLEEAAVQIEQLKAEITRLGWQREFDEHQYESNRRDRYD